MKTHRLLHQPSIIARYTHLVIDPGDHVSYAEAIQLHQRYSLASEIARLNEEMSRLVREGKILRRILWICGAWILILEGLLLTRCG